MSAYSDAILAHSPTMYFRLGSTSSPHPNEGSGSDTVSDVGTPDHGSTSINIRDSSESSTNLAPGEQILRTTSNVVYSSVADEWTLTVIIKLSDLTAAQTNSMIAFNGTNLRLNEAYIKMYRSSTWYPFFSEDLGSYGIYYPNTSTPFVLTLTRPTGQNYARMYINGSFVGKSDNSYVNGSLGVELELLGSPGLYQHLAGFDFSMTDQQIADLASHASVYDIHVTGGGDGLSTPPIFRSNHDTSTKLVKYHKLALPFAYSGDSTEYYKYLPGYHKGLGGFSLSGETTSNRSMTFTAETEFVNSEKINWQYIIDDLVDGINLICNTNNNAILESAIDDGLLFKESVIAQLCLFLNEIISTKSENTTSLVLNHVIYELIKTDEITQLKSTLLLQASTSFLVKSIIHNIVNLSVIDQTVVSEYLTKTAQIILSAIDTIEKSESTEAKLVMGIVSLDYIDTNDQGIPNNVQMNIFVQDSMFFIPGFGEENNQVIVLNSQSKALSEFTNYGFNSADSGFLCRQDGIYKLGGTTDADAEIEWSVKTGVSDFDNSYSTSVPYAYLGIDYQGDIYLKTITSALDNKTERWYKKTVNNYDFGTSKVSMGKGVKARYWQFELVGSAPAKIKDIEIFPLNLKRRV